MRQRHSSHKFNLLHLLIFSHTQGADGGAVATHSSPPPRSQSESKNELKCKSWLLLAVGQWFYSTELDQLYVLDSSTLITFPLNYLRVKKNIQICWHYVPVDISLLWRFLSPRYLVLPHLHALFMILSRHSSSHFSEITRHNICLFGFNLTLC